MNREINRFLGFRVRMFFAEASDKFILCLITWGAKVWRH